MSLTGHFLVVGGAGYIGSHMVKMLLRQGAAVTVLDNLSTGHRDAVLGGELVKGDLDDVALLDRLFADHSFDGVFHFAAASLVAESMAEPDRYHHANVVCSERLFEAMERHNVASLVFSSSASVYGEPHQLPIREDNPAVPLNPYGANKLAVEGLIAERRSRGALRAMVFRYFNAAGADPEGELGERHDPETHLIPLCLQVAAGRRLELVINGTDFTTDDGSCVRDYVHVQDICHAHLLGMTALLNGKSGDCFNLGLGCGFSVLEIVNTVEEVTGRKLAHRIGPRRDGDPAALIADPGKVKRELGWQPLYPDLNTMIEHAWLWESNVRR